LENSNRCNHSPTKARALIELLASTPIIDLEKSFDLGDPTISLFVDIERLQATRANRAQLAKPNVDLGVDVHLILAGSELSRKYQPAKIDHLILRISSSDVSQ
jgi:hypothetical protein